LVAAILLSSHTTRQPCSDQLGKPGIDWLAIASAFIRQSGRFLKSDAICPLHRRQAVGTMMPVRPCSGAGSPLVQSGPSSVVGSSREEASCPESPGRGLWSVLSKASEQLCLTSGGETVAIGPLGGRSTSVARRTSGESQDVQGMRELVVNDL